MKRVCKRDSGWGFILVFQQIRLDRLDFNIDRQIDRKRERERVRERERE